MAVAVEFARLTNVVVLLLTMVILGTRVHAWWCTRWRCLLPAAGTGFISLMISLGTVDALIHGRPGGAGSFAVTLGALGLLMQACTVGLGRSSHLHDLHDGITADIAPARSGRAGTRRC